MTKRSTPGRGDTVTVSDLNTSVRGVVTLASKNGRSLAVAFDGMLGGHTGTILILRDCAGVYRSLITGEPITVTPDVGMLQ